VLWRSSQLPCGKKIPVRIPVWIVHGLLMCTYLCMYVCTYVPRCNFIPIFPILGIYTIQQMFVKIVLYDNRKCHASKIGLILHMCENCVGPHNLSDSVNL
jgi:hypothetical protein